MINARIRMAMWTFDQAEAFDKSAAKIEYYKMSYNFYEASMRSINGRVPTNWYKNAALIYPKLFSLGETSTGSYAETADFFEKYLEFSEKYKEPIDDRKQVEEAVKSIRHYLENQNKSV